MGDLGGLVIVLLLFIGSFVFGLRVGYCYLFDFGCYFDWAVCVCAYVFDAGDCACFLAVFDLFGYLCVGCIGLSLVSFGFGLLLVWVGGSCVCCLVCLVCDCVIVILAI